MSVTVRLYSQQELEAIKTGKNRWLATLFMNKHTFSETEIKHYPYNLRKSYLVYFRGEDEPTRVYAMSDFQLKQFLAREYNYLAIVEIVEESRKYRKIAVEV